MADLKLGRLPKVGLVRMTISIPEPLIMLPSTAGFMSRSTPRH